MKKIFNKIDVKLCTLSKNIPKNNSKQNQQNKIKNTSKNEEINTKNEVINLESEKINKTQNQNTLTKNKARNEINMKNYKAKNNIKINAENGKNNIKIISKNEAKDKKNNKKLRDENEDYIFEIKYDGYRILAFLEGENVVLKSRNNKDFSNKFENVKNYLKTLNKTMILDGEICCFDDKGRSDFGLLQNSIKTNKNDFCYIVFDLIMLNQKDLRKFPLLKRKKLLEENLKSKFPVLICEYVKNDGEKVFEFAKNNGLEGIVAKKVNSIYNGVRDGNWIKIKCIKRQEFVVLGYKTTQKNAILSAIFVGFFDKNNLFCVGKVGTGFSEKMKKNLRQKFEKLETKLCKIKNIDKFEKDIIFLKPKLVAEIKFREITKDNKLRQASFVALREDKNAKNVIKEFI